MSNIANKNLLSSTGIAILASLGIHGLLWAVLPGLTVDSQANQSPSQRTIGLVELSPQEQNRLPQVSNPVDNNLPPFASQLTELPPLPPAPPYQTSVIPPVQLSPGSAPIYNTAPNQNSAPPLQTFQVPLPPPPNTSFPPIPYESLPNSSNYYPLPPAPQAPPFVLPPNNGLPDARLTPDRTLPSDNEIATATPSPEPSLQPVPANPLAPETNPPVAANNLPEKGKQELLAMRENMRNNFPLQKTTPATNTRSMSRQEIAAALRQQSRTNQTTTPQPNTRSMSRQELAAALRQQSRTNQTTTPQPTRSMSRQEIAAALRGQVRNPSNELSEETKTALDNLEKFKLQQATVQAQNPDVVTKPPIRRKLTTCDRAIDGDVAVVGVVVNPEGKRLSEPNLITKTGKPDISQAQNYVRNYEFAKTGKTTNYNFRLEFDYVARKCAQASPVPTNTPKPPTTSIPEPTPAPSPESTPSSPTPAPTTTSAPSPLPSNSPKPRDLF